MAAMPSVGRIKQLSVLGVATAAVLGFSASSASADDVWLWACHGPNGATLPISGNPQVQLNRSFSGRFEGYGDDCSSTTQSDFGGGGKKLSLEASAAGTVDGASESVASFSVPAGLQLAGVKLRRETRGFTGSAAQQFPLIYEAFVGANTLEKIQSGGADTQEDFEKAATANSGEQLKLRVACQSPGASTSCPVPGSSASVLINRVGMKVTEVAGPSGDSKPQFAIGGIRNPAAGKLTLDIRATDAGVGLKMAEAWFEGQQAAATSANFDGAKCNELTPGDGTVDLPLDADCMKVTPEGLKLDVDAGPLSNEDHTLVVRVWDWAGNFTEKKQVLTVLNNPDLGTATRTLSIGTSGINVPTNPNANNNGSGGVAGASATSCRSPRLSMVLAEKPLRVKKRVPVLKYNKRYKFTGRLTCVINNRRRSAPKRTRVDILSQVGKKTTEGPGTTTSTSGKISVILAYTKSRTLIFRFTNSDGQRSQVRIKVTVAKK